MKKKRKRFNAAAICSVDPNRPDYTYQASRQAHCCFLQKVKGYSEELAIEVAFKGLGSKPTRPSEASLTRVVEAAQIRDGYVYFTSIMGEILTSYPISPKKAIENFAMGIPLWRAVNYDGIQAKIASAKK